MGAEVAVLVFVTVCVGVIVGVKVENGVYVIEGVQVAVDVFVGFTGMVCVTDCTVSDTDRVVVADTDVEGDGVIALLPCELKSNIIPKQ